MSSRVLRELPTDNRVINLCFQETAKRSPVNLRSLLRIPKRRNFKGIALFASTYIRLYERTGEPRLLQEAIRLLDWLLDQQPPGEFGWGHNHRLQRLDGTTRRNTPSIVATTYAIDAFLAVLEHHPADRYRDVIERAPAFVLEDLHYHEIETGARISYRPTRTGPPYIPNANALGGRLLVTLSKELDDPSLLDPAAAILDYVVARQDPIGGWKYSDPPSKSHLSMDNHHNGFIIESLIRSQQMTGWDRYSQAIDDALDFYREVLFDPDGAPNWDETGPYPRDIHAAAQGIITFSHAGDVSFSRQILDWVGRELFLGNGQFGYRKGRFLTRRMTLMRWSQAWMAWALATFLDARERWPGNKESIPKPSAKSGE